MAVIVPGTALTTTQTEQAEYVLKFLEKLHFIHLLSKQASTIESPDGEFVSTFNAMSPWE